MKSWARPRPGTLPRQRRVRFPNSPEKPGNGQPSDLRRDDDGTRACMSQIPFPHAHVSIEADRSSHNTFHNSQSTADLPSIERVDMLRAGGVVCGWIGASGPVVVGRAPGLPLGASMRLLGQRAGMPALVVRPGTGTSRDDDLSMSATSSTSSAASLLSLRPRPRWGWRRAAVVTGALQHQQQQPFGTSARSTTGHSSAEGAEPGAGGKAPKEGEEGEGEPKMGKIRLMVQRYGKVAVVTYLGVYVTTLGLLFGAIESGVNPFDYGVDSGNMVDKVTGMLEGYSWGEPVVESIRKNPHVGNFALAWILTKFTEPLRAVVTIGIVPRIARALGRAPPLQER